MPKPKGQWMKGEATRGEFAKGEGKKGHANGEGGGDMVKGKGKGEGAKGEGKKGHAKGEGKIEWSSEDAWCTSGLLDMREFEEAVAESNGSNGTTEAVLEASADALEAIVAWEKRRRLFLHMEVAADRVSEELS